LPSKVDTFKDDSFVAITFYYDNPSIVSLPNYGSASDYISASSTIMLFKKDTNVYIDSSYNIKQNLYNHNGFLNGFAKGSESDVILGTTEPLLGLPISEINNNNFI